MSEPAIKISNLSVKYNSQPTLQDISLEIGAGSFVGILGPNGAGKSTLLKVILGLIRPTTGKVCIFGASLAKPRSSCAANGESSAICRSAP
jgi:zinc transport system ATP-binding protein